MSHFPIYKDSCHSLFSSKCQMDQPTQLCVAILLNHEITKSPQREQRYWLYMENFKQYPHLQVSNSKSSFSTNLFGRFPNTYRQKKQHQPRRQTLTMISFFLTNYQFEVILNQSNNLQLLIRWQAKTRKNRSFHCRKFRKFKVKQPQNINQLQVQSLDNQMTPMQPIQSHVSISLMVIQSVMFNNIYYRIYTFQLILSLHKTS